MQIKKPISLKALAEILDLKYIGSEKHMITGINEIHKVERGDLTFVDVEKYYSKALNSAATTILINKEVECPEGKALLISPNPFSDYNRLVQHFSPFEPASQMIAESATIGMNTIVQPGVFIGNHVKIGKNCLIHANVTINDYSEIGDNVIIQPNTVIGGDAFYYKTRKAENGYFEKLESCGKVVIEDNVEIGSGCTIDRGVSGITRIGTGSKLDNMVHIAHGVVLGKNCLLAAQVGIAGKTIIGDEAIIWGQVGISKDLKIGNKVTILATSAVSKNLEGGKTYFGAPAEEARNVWRRMAALRKLPDLIDEWRKQ
ncbi:MAG: UDP-3-O-(3-hydroxymyristoyl)glucosamine N-acyltransferase [Chitinophagales bacterium]